jgi:3-methyladenine DNA glycosylase AlkD
MMVRSSRAVASARELQQELAALASPARARVMDGYFKGGLQGQTWRGVSLPQLRALAKRHRESPVQACLDLLPSRWHEDRLLALLILGEQVRRAEASGQDRLARLYLRQRKWVDQWDLVDSSAPSILGPFVARRGHGKLLTLAQSRRIWDRRIAIVATQHLIRQGRLEATFTIAQQLLGDREDLIHKATGWMLREAGQKDPARLRDFLRRHAASMPRTMLRYAIERLPKQEQARWRAARGSQAGASSST